MEILKSKYFWMVMVVLSLAVLVTSFRSYSYKKQQQITTLTSQVQSLTVEKQSLTVQLSTQKSENKTLSLANEKMKKEKQVIAKKYYPNGQLKSEYSNISSTEKSNDKKDLNLTLQDTTKMSSSTDTSKQQELNQSLNYKQDTLKEEKSSGIPWWVSILIGVGIGFGVHH